MTMKYPSRHIGSKNLPVTFEIERGAYVPPQIMAVERRGQSFGNPIQRWQNNRRQAEIATQLRNDLEQKAMVRTAELEESRIDIATSKAKRQLLEAESAETAELTGILQIRTEAQTLTIDKNTSHAHVTRIKVFNDIQKEAEEQGLEGADLEELNAVLSHMRSESLVNTMANREVAITDINDKFRKAVSFVDRQSSFGV
jgi:hypothetical protein